MSNIGFIGLGIMGRPMAGHLQAAGHTLFLHTIGPIPEELVSGGGTVCDFRWTIPTEGRDPPTP